MQFIGNFIHYQFNFARRKFLNGAIELKNQIKAISRNIVKYRALIKIKKSWHCRVRYTPHQGQYPCWWHNFVKDSRIGSFPRLAVPFGKLRKAIAIENKPWHSFFPPAVLCFREAHTSRLECFLPRPTALPGGEVS